ncbi:MAG: hypothetical protein H6861_07975 [Rhodospirillales bacterium]|nr:hypothetical protein [Rhodospirillales bacterium]
MSDSPQSPGSPSQDEEDNRLLSERFDEFKEALEMLYILANISGRIQFAQKWRGAAIYILGEELILCDEEGTDDREYRAELEQEAEARRIDFLDVLDGIEEKSVEKGALQIDYVRGKIEEWGRDVALLVYGRKIVDKFIAPPPEPVEVETPVEEASASAPVSETASVEVEVEVESTEQEEIAVVDPLDSIRPIDMVNPAPPPPQDTASPPAPQTQKAVSMKFVSFKNKKGEDGSSGSAPPEGQA